MKKIEQLGQDLKESMLAKDAQKTSTLRMLIADLRNYSINKGAKEDILSDEEVDTVLKKAAKQRKDSIEAYKSGGREDLAAKEQYELDLINTYLPEQFTEDQIKQAVESTIQELGISSMQQTGQLMGALKQKYGESIDLGTAGKFVREFLN
jgi:uncharacterized protein